MAAQRRTAVELSKVLSVGHRAALARVNGEVEFSLGDLELTAEWLGVSETSLMAPRIPAAAA